MNVWEKRETETERAFLAFKMYRDAGPQRTMLGTYRTKKAAKGGPPAKNVPGCWRSWARQHDWKSRVDAFDAENERISQELYQEQMRQNYQKGLERFRQAHLAEVQRRMDKMAILSAMNLRPGSLLSKMPDQAVD